MPLKLGIYSGCAVAVFGLLMMAYTIWTWAKYGTPSGYEMCIRDSLRTVLKAV